MKTTLAIIIASLGLSGCGLFNWGGVDPITINRRAVERTPLNLPDPAPIKPTAPNWILITPANQDRVWKELKEKNVDLVLFALTDDGYEELAIDMAQIRNFIAQQREIIVRYRDYYEPRKAKDDSAGK